MRRRLDLQIAVFWVAFELACQGPLDIARPRVMPLDEIAVIGVHDAHDAREIGGGARIEGMGELGGRRRKFGHDVGDFLGDLLKTRRFNALNTLYCHDLGRFFDAIICCIYYRNCEYSNLFGRSVGRSIGQWTTEPRILSRCHTLAAAHRRR